MTQHKDEGREFQATLQKVCATDVRKCGMSGAAKEGEPPMKAKVNNELLYFDVLKRMTRYQTVERMRRKSESDWGLPFEEALEMAYENVITEAKNAIHGKHRPKTKCK